MSSKQHNNIKRRKFLKKLWVILGIIISAEFIYLIFNFFTAGKKVPKTTVKYFEAGTLSEFKKNTITQFRSRHFFLARLKNGEFRALSTRCTHLGCALTCDEDKNLLICPCHSSMFDIQGNVLRSPATRNLDLHEVVVENNTIKVNTGVVLSNKERQKAV